MGENGERGTRMHAHSEATVRRLFLSKFSGHLEVATLLSKENNHMTYTLEGSFLLQCGEGTGEVRANTETGLSFGGRVSLGSSS